MLISKFLNMYFNDFIYSKKEKCTFSNLNSNLNTTLFLALQNIEIKEKDKWFIFTKY